MGEEGGKPNLTVAVLTQGQNGLDDCEGWWREGILVGNRKGWGNIGMIHQGRGNIGRIQHGRGNIGRIQQGRGNIGRIQQGRGNIGRIQQDRVNIGTKVI